MDELFGLRQLSRIHVLYDAAGILLICIGVLFIGGRVGALPFLLLIIWL